jgi:hypothetical protein
MIVEKYYCITCGWSSDRQEDYVRIGTTVFYLTTNEDKAKHHLKETISHFIVRVLEGVSDD